MKRLSFWIIVSLVCHIGVADTFTVTPATTYKAQRIGLNWGINDYYSSYLLKNRAAGVNGGMQPAIIPNKITVQSGATTTSFTDGNPYSGIVANQYAGGTWQDMCNAVSSSSNCTGGAGPSVFSVVPGTTGSVGCLGTITSNTAANGSSAGASFTVVTTSCPSGTPAPGAHDQIYVYQAGGSSAATTSGEFNFNEFGWNQVTSGSGTATIDTTSGHFPAGFTGIQVVELSNPSSGDTSGVQTVLDSSTNPYYYFSGSYQQCIQVNILSGTGLALKFQTARTTSGINSTATTGISGSGYQTVCGTVTGSESSSAIPSGAADISYTLTGQGSVDIIGPTLISAADTSSSQFNNQMLSDVETWNPGQCRYWAGQNGETLANWISPMYERFTSSIVNHAPFEGAGVSTQIGLFDFLEGAVAAGCPTVNIVVPLMFRWNVDAQNLVDFLNGGSGTTYGAKRIALGRTAGYATLFSKIILSYANEVWNDAAGNEAMEQFTGTGSQCSATGTACWAYPAMVTQFCGAMKGDANWSSSVMKCSATVQTGNGGFWVGEIISVLDSVHAYVDSFAANEYSQFDVTSCSSPTPWVSAFVEDSQQNNFDASSASGFYQTENAAKTRSVDVYEANNSTNSGSCTQAQLTGYPEGQGYGIADILAPLQANKTFGTTDNDFFTLYQQNTGISTSGGASSIAEWGAKTGPGGEFNNYRPMFLAAEQANGCAGSSGVGISVVGSSLTMFNFPSSNGVNAENNTPYLWGYGFLNGSNLCVLIANIDPTNSHTATFAGTTPSGTCTTVTYTGTSLTENNEAANSSPNVTLSTTTGACASTLTIPAHSSVSYTWPTGSTPPVLAPTNLSGIIVGPNIAIP